MYHPHFLTYLSITISSPIIWSIIQNNFNVPNEYVRTFQIESELSHF